jgi:hypothetical protein
MWVDSFYPIVVRNSCSENAEALGSPPTLQTACWETERLGWSFPTLGLLRQGRLHAAGKGTSWHVHDRTCHEFTLSLSLLLVLSVPLSFSCFHRGPEEDDGTWRQRTEMPVVGTKRGKWGGRSWNEKDACGVQARYLGGSGVGSWILSRYRCMKQHDT